MPHDDCPGIRAFLISAHSSSGDRLAATVSIASIFEIQEPHNGPGTNVTALARRPHASAKSLCDSARKSHRGRPSCCPHPPSRLVHMHTLNSEPRPAPCLWLRPCNGVRLPGGSAEALTHWDLSARACRPLGPSCSRAHFLLLMRVMCVSSQIKCSGWSSSLTTNEKSFGIYSFVCIFLNKEAGREDSAGGRSFAREAFGARAG